MTDELEIPTDSRDIKTVPEGLEPPPPFVGEPPDDIPGAPDWANLLLRKLRGDEKRSQLDRIERMLTTIQADVALMREDFHTFKAETRGHLSNHDVEIEQLRGGLKTLEKRFDDHLESHRDDDDR